MPGCSAANPRRCRAFTAPRRFVDRESNLVDRQPGHHSQQQHIPLIGRQASTQHSDPFGRETAEDIVLHVTAYNGTFIRHELQHRTSGPAPTLIGQGSVRDREHPRPKRVLATRQPSESAKDTNEHLARKIVRLRCPLYPEIPGDPGASSSTAVPAPSPHRPSGR